MKLVKKILAISILICMLPGMVALATYAEHVEKSFTGSELWDIFLTVFFVELWMILAVISAKYLAENK